MTFDCTSMITLWRLDFTSPLYAGKYQTRTRRVLVQQEEYTRLQCNARYSVLVINYFYLRNYKCMKYKRCLLRCSGTRVHTSFYSMKGQRAFLLSPGWYAGSLQDKHTHTPPPLPHLFRLWYTTYLFSGVKGEDYCGSMVSCPGTQHDKPLWVWKLPESHRLTKTQQFSLVCVCSQVSVSIHSLCRCSDTYSYINGEKMVNFLVCESVFFLQQLNHQHQWSTSLTFHSSWSISERQKTSFMLSRYNFFTTCNYGFVLVPLSIDVNWKIYRGVKFLKV